MTSLQHIRISGERVPGTNSRYGLAARVTAAAELPGVQATCQGVGDTTSVTQPHRPDTNDVVTHRHNAQARLSLTLATDPYRRRYSLYVRPTRVVDRDHEPGRCT